MAVILWGCGDIVAHQLSQHAYQHRQRQAVGTINMGCNLLTAAIRDWRLRSCFTLPVGFQFLFKVDAWNTSTSEKSV
jgi:hypothetical protein